MKITCPHCNTPFPLESASEDASARELFGELAARPVLAGPLIAYLGLFKPKKQALRWSRALGLARQVFELGCDEAALAVALAETVESLRQRRQSANWKPLTSHNYLASVCASRQAAPRQPGQPGRAPASQTGSAMIALEDFKHE